MMVAKFDKVSKLFSIEVEVNTLTKLKWCRSFSAPCTPPTGYKTYNRRILTRQGSRGSLSKCWLLAVVIQYNLLYIRIHPATLLVASIGDALLFRCYRQTETMNMQLRRIRHICNEVQ